MVYLNKERYLAMDELAPLSRARTQPRMYAMILRLEANISEVQMYYENIMRYVDGI